VAPRPVSMGGRGRWWPSEVTASDDGVVEVAIACNRPLTVLRVRCHAALVESEGYPTSESITCASRQ
jgi:hypothetical protein